MKNEKRTKNSKRMKLLIVTVTLLLGISGLTDHAIKCLATSGSNQKTITENGYEVIYKVDQEYGNKYNCTVTLKNTSDEKIENWALRFPLDDSINEIWNANIYSKENGIYTINNPGWNQVINPGESVNFGFVATKKEEDIDFPERYSIPVTYSNVEENTYNLSYEKVNNTCVKIQIKNTSESDINYWSFDFKSKIKIRSTDNGVVDEISGYHYIKNGGYSTIIKPNQTLSVHLYIDNYEQDLDIEDFNLYSSTITKYDAYNHIKFKSYASMDQISNFMENKDKYIEFENLEQTFVKVNICKSNSQESNVSTDMLNDYSGSIIYSTDGKKTSVDVTGQLYNSEDGIVGTLVGELADETIVSFTINYTQMNEEPYVFFACGEMGNENDKYMVYGTTKEKNNKITDEYDNATNEGDDSENANDFEPVSIDNIDDDDLISYSTVGYSSVDEETETCSNASASGYDTVCRQNGITCFYYNGSYYPLSGVSLFCPTKQKQNSMYIARAKGNTLYANAKYYAKQKLYCLGINTSNKSTAKVELYTKSKDVRFTDPDPVSHSWWDMSVAVVVPYGKYLCATLANYTISLPKITVSSSKLNGSTYVNSYSWKYSNEIQCDFSDSKLPSQIKKGYSGYCYTNILNSKLASYELYGKATITYSGTTLWGTYKYNYSFNSTATVSQTIKRA